MGFSEFLRALQAKSGKKKKIIQIKTDTYMYFFVLFQKIQ